MANVFRRLENLSLAFVSETAKNELDDREVNRFFGCRISFFLGCDLLELIHV